MRIFPSLVLVALTLFVPAPLVALTYTGIGAGLPGIYDGSTAWGDYDADGDLDILLTGNTAGGPISAVYRNDDGTFVDIAVGLLGVSSGSGSWGDYDRDGDLDILLAGATSTVPRARVYRNVGGAFVLVRSLVGVSGATAAWGDYDRDGDLDILLTGNTAAEGRIIRIYRNDGGAVFTQVSTTGQQGVSSGAVAWGDYDNDTDLDFLLSGDTGSAGISSYTTICRNNGGSFTNLTLGLINVHTSSAAWGDYDSDGDLDILIAGDTEAAPGIITRVYRYSGGFFSDIAAGLVGIRAGSVSWGDCDNDGDLDILLAGSTGTDGLARIYLNNSGSFSPLGATLPRVSSAAASWGDYDNDGDLDVLLAGNTETGPITRIYRSNGSTTNMPPSAPSGLAATATLEDVTLGWTAASDAETPTAGLSYNVRIGTVPGGSDILSAMSDAGTGYRRVPALGNLQKVLSVTLDPVGTQGACYWSVQAVDAAFAGSPFAAEGTFYLRGFREVEANFSIAGEADVAFGDYDADGDLDVLTSGSPTRVYRNDGATFTDINAGIPALQYGSVAWGDYDNDDDLDILIAGLSPDQPGGDLTALWRNDDGTFVEVSTSLPDVSYGDAAFGDYDNDGDLDIVLTGSPFAGLYYFNIFQNNAGAFTDIGAGLPGFWWGSVAWGDYDADGDLDILVTGFMAATSTSRVYRNDGGVFTDIEAGLIGIHRSSGEWADYDADGDLDILLTGEMGFAGTMVTRLYRNDAGAFTEQAAVLPDAENSAGAWGDYDNDGDLDLLFAGRILDGAVITRVFNNNAGTFTDITAHLRGSVSGAVSWGDYDNDGNLDALVAGVPTALYRGGGTENAPPSAPTGLTANVTPTSVTLSWDAATDAETPVSGLSYNVRVGTTPGGSEVMSAMADAATGHRRLAEPGNAQQRTSRTLQIPSSEWRYWSVQAIDGAFAGSTFAPEQDWTATDVDDPSQDGVPRPYSLLANEPNPFTSMTAIGFSLPSASSISLAIYDPSGRRLRTLADGHWSAGTHRVAWDGKDARGRRVPAGVYFYELHADAFHDHRRMVLVR